MTLPPQSWRACEACFKGKIKCDRKLPSCTQCVRRGRSPKPCIYRQTQLDLVLRDETAKTTNLLSDNGRLENSCPGPSPSSKSDDSSSSKSSRSTSHQTLSIDGILLNDVAPVVGKKILLTSFPHGIYARYLPAIYLSSTTDLGLTSSIEAIGLMCLAAARSERRLMLQAREKHLIALKKVNRSISYNSDITLPYSTVASVMLLALFAVMSPDNLNSLEIWTKHVNGALSILVTHYLIHGHFSSIPGVHNLIQHIVNSLHLSCFQQRRRVPKSAIRLYDCLHDNGKAEMHIHGVINGLADLHMKMWKTQTISLHVAHTLDQELAAIISRLAESHSFTSTPNPANQQDDPNVHKYTSHRAAQIWNFVRILRLSLNSLLLTYLSNMDEAEIDSSSAGAWFPLNSQSLKWHILSNIASISDEVCASVPSFLRPNLFNYYDERLDITHWAHSLIWPITMVQSTPNLPPTLATYIAKVLPILWQAARFPHTTMPGKSLLNKSPLKDWTHIFFWC